MAGSNFFALIDDIASILDDVALMTKVAAKKTSGVLGDDLALNAQQVTGLRAERELPVVWAVAKGSLVNKAILVPLALTISLVAHWAILPLLMFGGLYLCYEGVEKLVHKLLHRHGDEAAKAARLDAVMRPDVDLVALEKSKIKGAIRTDFVLSAEIITIALGTVAESTFTVQVLVLIGVAVIITFGVYGVVAAIVKLDDGGLYLSQRVGGSMVAQLQRRLGFAILYIAPWMMKTISVVGTVAMFMVGGGILTHGTPGAHDLIHQVAHHATPVPGVGPLLVAVIPSILDMVAGVLAGLLALGTVTGALRLWRIARPTAA